MKRIIAYTLIIFMAAFITACGPATDSQWLKVNTHTHTSLSDGMESPEYVIQWYKDNGYDALAITDHGLWYDGIGDDIIIIPGNEESRPQHYTSLNYGEIEILNHPNYLYSYRPIYSDGVKFFEVYNAHHLANNEGDFEHPGTEVIWNEILKSGRIIYGIASDDSHFYEGYPIGIAWIMVRVNGHTQESILTAMAVGDFYSSTGVYLSEYSTATEYVMTVDFDKTDADICSFELIEAGAFKRGKVTCFKPDGSEIYAWGQPVEI